MAATKSFGRHKKESSPLREEEDFPGSVIRSADWALLVTVFPNQAQRYDPAPVGHGCSGEQAVMR